MPATIAPEPTIPAVPRLSGFAKTLIGCVVAVGLAGAAFHAFRFQAPPAGPLTAHLENAYPQLPKFYYPLWFGHAGDGSGRVFVAEKRGLIHVFKHDPAVTAAATFLDLKDSTYQGHQEEGLLGVAFDPKFSENGHLFVHYTRAPEGELPRRGRIARFTVDPKDPNRVDRSSELVVLEQHQPWGNHNGGCLVFGPDGFLYFSFGDGGAGGDPQDNGQNLGTLLGTIGRIDVRNATTAKPYAVPPDNPFVGQAGARPEIWAWGLRNVWRFSFDRANGDCWAGDVGQNTKEEIDRIVKGGNYGWRAYEADLVFDQRKITDELAKSAIPPVVSYGRRQGQSVTGGYVYRGTAQQALVGRYLYADYGSTFLWGLDYDREKGAVRANDFLATTGVMIASFGEDAAGEVYVVAFDGRIYRVVAGAK